jgi:hypothetical protein
MLMTRPKLTDLVSPVETIDARTRPARRTRSPWAGKGAVAAHDAAVGLILTLVAFAAYGPHAVNGGFYSDDWNFSADYANASKDGFFAGLSELLDISASRPVGTAYAAIRSEAFGLDPTGHLIVAGLLGLAVAVLFYALLRVLGMSPLHSGAIALLVLLFPLADATRLWAAGSAANLGISLYLGGVLVALAGLRRTGPASWAMHAAAVLLYAASVLVYEFTTVPVLLASLLYRARVPWRRALERGALDVAAIGTVLLVVTSQTTLPRQPLSSLPEQVVEITKGALMVVSWSVAPLGDTTHLTAARWIGGLIVVLVLGAALRRFLRGEHAAELRPWLLLAGAAAVAIAAGYLILVPAVGYNPAHRGIANRINAFSSLGIAVFVFSLAMLAALQLSWQLRRSATALAVALTAILVVGYAVRLYSDGQKWDDAAVAQGRILDDFRKSPRPARGERIVAFGVPAFQGHGIPIFHETWDLSGALQLLWHDHSLEAYPANNGRAVVCRANSAYVVGRDEPVALPYGTTRFLSARTRRSQTIGSDAECQSWIEAERAPSQQG